MDISNIESSPVVWKPSAAHSTLSPSSPLPVSRRFLGNPQLTFRAAMCGNCTQRLPCIPYSREKLPFQWWSDIVLGSGSGETDVSELKMLWVTMF